MECMVCYPEEWSEEWRSAMECMVCFSEECVCVAGRRSRKSLKREINSLAERLVQTEELASRLRDERAAASRRCAAALRALDIIEREFGGLMRVARAESTRGVDRDG